MHVTPHLREHANGFEFPPTYVQHVEQDEARRLFPDRPWLWGGITPGTWPTEWVALSELWLGSDDDPDELTYYPPPDAHLAAISRRSGYARHIAAGSGLSLVQLGVYETGRPEEITRLTLRASDGGRAGFPVFVPMPYGTWPRALLLGRALPTVAVAPVGVVVEPMSSVMRRVHEELRALEALP